MFLSRLRSYQRLPVSELDQQLDKALDEETNVNRSGPSPTLTWAATAICILCTLINVSSLGYNYFAGGNTYSFPSSTTFITSKGISRDKIDTLRRPSQFIGLDKVYRNHTGSGGIKSFVNFPILMTQIDSTKPYEVTKPSMGVWTKIGTVYPEISKMFLSPSISTIVQFRALDFGMEICELDITVPSTVNLTTFTTSLALLQVHQMRSKTPLYQDSLSYSTRPRRGELVDEFSVTLGTNWTHRFNCTMDEIYTFEVACGAFQPDCALEWAQNKEHDSLPALRMIQYSTL
ncbi:hypothetical protein BDN70DRAFT_992462 [Pholiota conissans]|uniref:Ubiquitin 3 binding protein But2 C-terminal domain-containing protein n=1 Tax=Pholiota conissans TaxID=109636 RepID=A0A9P6D234_9AGAR|nr:hypothetical protein BDN70DRAFT_992462 [Pholiota conissans]